MQCILQPRVSCTVRDAPLTIACPVTQTIDKQSKSNSNNSKQTTITAGGGWAREGVFRPHLRLRLEQHDSALWGLEFLRLRGSEFQGLPVWRRVQAFTVLGLRDSALRPLRVVRAREAGIPGSRDPWSSLCAGEIRPFTKKTARVEPSIFLILTTILDLALGGPVGFLRRVLADSRG